MSTSPDSEFNLDLHFLPAWAQQPANKTIYAPPDAEAQMPGRRDRREGPSRGRDQRGPRPGGGRGPRPGGPERRFDRGERGRPQGGPGGPGRDRGRPRGEEPRGRGPRPEPEPLPEVDIQFIAEEQGVDSLARQIKMTGRAYPLFAVAQLILEKPDRHSVRFTTKKKPDGTVAQPLFACALDDSLWLNEDEAVAYILDKHFATFYQAERTKTDPPKGTYTFVAQCGMSGQILGPPNYHDYQNQLRKLHAERFSRLPFDAFKARVRIVRDEETVKKWIEDQSWKVDYSCLNVPEPLKLATRDDVEKHFRQTHLANIVKQVDSHQLTGTASRSMPCRALQRLVRVKWEEQNRFPLQLATSLSQQFASRGLQFFKVNKTVTHVAVARPHYLDLETNVVSDNVKRIVEFINAHPKTSRRQLFEALAPAAVPTTQLPVEGAAPVELTPEAGAIITDLHWLVHQGHVIEFANGTLETAKKPVPKPPKPAPAPQPAVAPAAPAEAGATETATAATVEMPATPEAPPAEGGAHESAAPTESHESAVPTEPGATAEPSEKQPAEQHPIA